MFEDSSPVYPYMTLPSPIILRVWENDFGVPSVDPECLQLILLFKMHRINVIVQHACCPYWLDIPSIKYDGVTVTKSSDIISSALSLCKKSNETVLDTRPPSRLNAYKQYFMESFADVFHFDCWINDNNYEYVIKTWFSNVIPFPLHYLYLKNMREKAKIKFESLLGSRDPDKFKIRQLQNAADCLEDFSGLLKDGRPYFFGKYPTVLDVIIYSYLAVCLNMPLPNPYLQNLLRGNQLLVKFVKNVTQTYFPDTSLDFKYVEPVKATYERVSTRSLILAGISVSIAMLIYAYSVGLIKFEYKELGLSATK